MDIRNTKAELEAEKKRCEAKYGIQIKNEEQYFQIIKQQQLTSLWVLFGLMLFMVGFGVILGFIFGTQFAQMINHYAPANASAIIGGFVR